MVKKIQEEIDLPLDLLDLFQLVARDNAFQRRFHRARGDSDVFISEWSPIPAAAGAATIKFPLSEPFLDADDANAAEAETAQRLNCFVWHEAEQATKCLETQTFRLYNSGRLFLLKSSLRPDMGNLFRLDFEWRARTVAPGQSRVTMVATVECTRQMWGVSSYLETFLEKGALGSLRIWAQLALKLADAYQRPAFLDDTDTDYGPNGAASSISSRHSGRHRNHARSRSSRRGTATTAAHATHTASVASDSDSDAYDRLGENVRIDISNSQWHNRRVNIASPSPSYFESISMAMTSFAAGTSALQEVKENTSYGRRRFLTPVRVLCVLCSLSAILLIIHHLYRNF